jgi:sec-independent protein translocase protein TatA
MTLPGPQEMMIVLFILMVLFGGSKLPKLAHSLGSARKEFERGQAEGVKAEND